MTTLQSYQFGKFLFSCRLELVDEGLFEVLHRLSILSHSDLQDEVGDTVVSQ